MPQRTNTLTLGADRALYVGEIPATGWHCHASPVLLMGLSGRFALHWSAGRVETCHSALVDAGVEHLFDPCGEVVALVYLEPDSPEARGLRSRKGAPNTFDVGGFLHLLTRLRNEDEVAIPVFDRNLEISRGSADIVGPEDRILIVEGNYLLLDEAPWNTAQYDLTAFIDVPEAELDRRLLARWAHFGKTPEQARAWIDGNDMPNIRRVNAGSRAADVVLRQD